MSKYQLRVGIVDDEVHVITQLKNMLEQHFSTLELVGTATNFTDAQTLLKEGSLDLVFLDIEIGTKNAFDLLQQWSEHHYQIIFVTAHSHYAIRAIKFSALDYLLKPLNLKELTTAIQRAKDQHTQQNHQKQIQYLIDLQKVKIPQRIIIKELESIHVVELNELVYLEADAAYTKVHTLTNVLISTQHLKHYELLLDDADFIRIHRSFLVNGHWIKQFHRADGGQVKLKNGIHLPVSTRKREVLLTFLRRAARS